MPDPRILILFHESCTAELLEKYRVGHLARLWRAQGLDVRIQCGLDPDPAAQADLLFAQVDLSVVPARYRRAIARAGSAVNGRVRDVRKRSFSANLVKRGDAWTGPVIVKTDCNSGGLPEAAWRAARRRGRLWQRAASLRRRIRERMDSERRLARARALDPSRYPVYDRLGDVPPGVFRNRRLVVERFLPERDGDAYCMRSYTFLGDAGITLRGLAADPVVRGHTATHFEVVDDDPAIAAQAKALGLDYGKLDYTLHGGRPVLLDVNPTPTFGRIFTEAWRALVAERLAPGIAGWLGGGV